MDSSPIRTEQLKRSSRRILSSDEESYRSQQASTHSGCSAKRTCTSSSQTVKKHKRCKHKRPVSPLAGDRQATDHLPSVWCEIPARKDNQQRCTESPGSSPSQGRRTPSQGCESPVAGLGNSTAADVTTEENTPVRSPTLMQEKADAGHNSAQTREADSPEQGEGIIIQMVPSDEVLAWDSDMDSACSETSTPGYKRGKYAEPDLSTVLQEIRLDSQLFIPSRQVRKPSLHLLADSRVGNWPASDQICVIEYQPDWEIRHWISAVRAETIRIQSGTVIIYLERILSFSDVPPFKNLLQTLCKAVRAHRKDTRTFISNLLPGHSPLCRKCIQADFILLQAIRSINCSLGKIFYLSVFEHFTSKSGKVIHPTYKYIQEDQQLTKLGCLVFRECLMREAGLKTYWF